MKKQYFVCIEGQEYGWDKSEISYEEIIELGGWEAAEGIIEIDKDQNEDTLQPGSIVELKPGHGFAKKICWKRGLDIFQARLEEELNLLQSQFPDIEYVEDGRWVLSHGYVYGGGWAPNKGPVAFQIPDAVNKPPYGIYVPSGLTFSGVAPTNYKDLTGVPLPFDGKWGVFSWAPKDGHWRPGATVRSGANMLNWALGFRVRFEQGA